MFNVHIPESTPITQPDPEPDHQEEASEEDDESVPRAKVSEHLTIAQEQELVEWFQAHPLFYDQTLKDFKMRAKRERLLDEKAKLMGLNGTCP